MSPEIFIGTSGYYSLLIKIDNMHKRAGNILLKAAENKIRFATTDYILDEIVTLLKVRGHDHLISELFVSIFTSKACRVEWMDQDRFMSTKSYFLKHRDHHWSFTDCFSFVVMKELGLTEALTKNKHFREAGFFPFIIE